MTSSHFNYGPSMSFDRLGGDRRRRDDDGSDVVTKSSEYLGMSPRSTESTTSTLLGSHWKRVEDVVQRVADELDPPTPAPASRALAPESQETMMLMSCLKAQEKRLDELLDVLDRVGDRCDDAVKRMRHVFGGLETTSREFWTKTSEHVARRDVELNTEMDGIDARRLGINEHVQQRLLKAFHGKKRLETFVREHEPFLARNETTCDVLARNARRLAELRSWLAEHKKNEPAGGPLTEFEHENPRVETVFGGLKTMIATLELSDNERAVMNACIAKLEKTSSEGVTMGAKFKCEQVMRRLLALMTNWDHRAPGSASSTLLSSSFESVFDRHHHQKTSSSSPDVFYSSSFALSDLSDSNLADLEGSVRAARIRNAVDSGMPPSGRIVASPWPTSATCSFNTDGLSSVQSLDEPWTLSSYEPISSAISTTSSCSSSFWDRSLADTQSLSNSVVMKTSLSKEDDVVSARGAPRSAALAGTTASNGARTDSIGSLNFSTVSLGEMVEDVLHTARDAAETQSHHLMEALQCSASKCGVAISDLMTAISSSSESLSNTQTSHTSNSITH